MSQEIIDAGFDQIRAERFLHAHLAEARDPGFWRALNPHLTISDRPFLPDLTRAPVEPAVVDRAARQLVDEGFLQAPPLVPADRVDALRRGALRVVDAGFAPGFACVYDEFYQTFQGLDDLFAPLLGEGYLMVLDGLWTYHVPVGDAGYRQWTSASPHRDALRYDPRVIGRDMPSIITVWIPLTDVSPLDSCIYAVPAPGDPDYHSPDDADLLDHDLTRLKRFRLQDVRALPAAAGSVLGWSTHLVHWGSRSSRFATGPRVSVAVYFQRRDTPLFHPTTVAFGAPIPFDTRLTLIAGWLGKANLWKSGGHE